ncbi:MAG: hypothetical protein QW587_04960 [Candidatus Bathyarchaeia archaeon]
MPSGGCSQVIARPTGGKRALGSATTTSAYQTVITITPPSGKRLKIAKSLVSCTEDTYYRFLWNGQAIRDVGSVDGEVYVAARIPFPDWYGWGFGGEMLGDGSKSFTVQVRQVTATGTCYFEVDYDEV